MLCTFDTNVLVYTVPGADPVKHTRSRELLIRAARVNAGLVPLQTLGEFSNVAARKLRMNIAGIRRRIDDWRAVFPPVAATEGDLEVALDLVAQYRIGFWDALLCATASRAGVAYLLSEDFQDGRRFGALTMVNPFAPANDRLIDRILPP